ncbi:hypothetical protein [uncultured Corynebacterium sp.]|uniref:hypothetical protein n=1 Tax=uncultured Corynebacterium sp. TaxID=159447 RepID=UPI002592F2F0|nr:hypothetical protein [uncultured Corynebacterium sp.]
MEDTHVKSLKPAAAVSAIAASALLLAGCSAGQITQTSDQVAAVDGAGAASDNQEVAVQDVTVVLDDNGQAALKFTAINQNDNRKPHTLQSATVNGTPVQLGGPTEIPAQCTLVGDSAESLSTIPQAEGDCIQYVPTTVVNKDFAFGGNVDVSFRFDAGNVDVTATVSAPTLPSGESHRNAGEDQAHAAH